jgi:hypothetical protein
MLNKIVSSASHKVARLSLAVKNAKLLAAHGALESYIGEWCGHLSDDQRLNRLSYIKFRAVKAGVQFKGEFADNWFTFDGTLPAGRQWHEYFPGK